MVVGCPSCVVQATGWFCKTRNVITYISLLYSPKAKAHNAITTSIDRKPKAHNVITDNISLP